MHTPLVGELSGISRKVGAVHLAVAGAVDGITGVALLSLAWGDGVERISIRYVQRILNRGVLLDLGPGAIRLAVAATTVLGIVLLSVALVQLVAARLAYLGRGRQFCLQAALAGILTLVSVPWSVTGAGLIYLTGALFDSAGTD